jgi:hypothetical protein
VRESDFYDEQNGVIRFWKIFWTVVGVVVVISLVFGVIGFFGGWFSEGKRIVSPTNVKAQHTAIIENWETAITSSRNACSVGNPDKEEGDPTLVEDPALAYAATYRRVVVDYNRRQKNLFESRLVGPSGYPREIPRLDNGPETDWCEVAAQLESLR